MRDCGVAGSLASMVPSDLVAHDSHEHASGNARRMTVAEWADLPEDEPGEWVDGYLVEEEMPDLTHEIVVSWLIRVLGNWLGARGGFVFGSEAKFLVGARRGRKPDVTLYLPGGAVLPARGLVRTPPDVVVEVVLPTARDARRDRIDKVDDYAAFGIQWYWLVNPERRVVEILELGPDGRYVRAVAAADGTLDVPGCPELALDVTALWAEVERLGPPVADEQPPAR